MWIAVALTIIHVMLDNRQPAKTMAWVMVVIFVPIAGILLYFFFGINQRRKKRAEWRQINQLGQRSQQAEPYSATAIDMLTSGNEYFASLLADIHSARSHIHIDCYIIDDDRQGRKISEALIEKAREGIEIRIIYDDVGCWRTGNRFFENMREEGIEVAAFLPVRFPSFTSKINYRNHRKLVIIDGTVGYIGGMNIAERYTVWRDTMLRLQGSVVYAMQRAFLEDWYRVDGTLITQRKYYPNAEKTADEQTATAVSKVADRATIVTSAPVDAYPAIMQQYVKAIASARRYILIQTPYFMPNEPVLFALKMAIAAGVKVKVMCPLHSDTRLTQWASRSFLREMTDAGAEVLLFLPTVLHAKTMVIDDKCFTCGSTNIDIRSFENNFEANVFIDGEDAAVRMRHIFENDAKDCAALSDRPDLLSPSLPMRLWESIVRLLAPVL